MSKTSSAVKMKYNRANYRRYEFNVRVESNLEAILERYKSNPANNISELIKASICAYIGMEREDADVPVSDNTKVEKMSKIISVKTKDNIHVAKNLADYSEKRKRRVAVKSILKQLEEIKASEESYRDNIPVNLQGSVVYETADECVSQLEEAIELLVSAY